ncbi:MAG: IMP cyclohydrolase [Christensenellales bacterium]|jgi:IMP cyclohydrolase
MSVLFLDTVVSQNRYPGRGIVMGRSDDGLHGFIGYFIMGRSENSRNRIFAEEGAGIRTQAYDPTRMADPSLIIYAPVRVYRDITIVTNGDQTDTIYAYLTIGKTWQEALRTREFEPDAPNYTPRISGIMRCAEGCAYALSILKSAEGDPEACGRFFFEYENPKPGRGHFIHTYEGDGDPLPSFRGEPTPVRLQGNLEEMTRGLWEALDEDNKISLFTRFIRIDTGETQTRILNKYR